MSDVQRVLGFIVFCLLCSTPAQAGERVDEVAPPSVTAGLEARLGYGFPFGEFGPEGFDATSISLVVSSLIPVEVHFNVHLLDERLRFGALAGYAEGIGATHCVDCRGSRTRVGITARYDVLPVFSPHFWVGGELAWEGFDFNIGSVSAQYGGVSYGLEFGVDFSLNPRFTWGLVASATSGGFLTETVTVAQTVTAPIDRPAFHGYFVISGRVEYELL